MTAFYLTIERAQNHFIYLSKFQLSSSLIVNVANVCLSVLFGLYGYLISLLLNSILQFSILFKRNKPDWLFILIKLTDLKKILFKSIPLMISGLSFITFKTIDSVVILNFYGLETLGIYSLAILATSILFGLTNSISVVVFPMIQELIGQKKELQLTKYTSNAMISASFILPLVIYPLHCLIHNIVRFYIPDYLSGLEYFDIILLSSFFYSSINLLINIYTSRNKIFRIILINIIHILLAIVMAYLSFKFFKTVKAVVLSIAISQIFYFLTISIDSLKFISEKIKIHIYLLNITKPFFLLLFIAGICNNFISDYDFKSIVLKITTFIFFYTILALKIRPELNLLLYKLNK